MTELLIEEGFDISITGFEPVEIDQIAIDFEEDTSDPADSVESEWLAASVVSKPGDIWELGEHRLSCGDARNTGDIGRLMSGKRAAMAFLDPPYNLRVRSIVGRGRIKHAEFAMASGEMSRRRVHCLSWRKHSGTPPASPETARSISSAWTGGISVS